MQPGAKKYRRFLNNIELIEVALSDSEGEELEIEVEFTVEYHSPFSIIFEDEKFKKLWEPFVDISMEDEMILLDLLEAKKSKKGIASL